MINYGYIRVAACVPNVRVADVDHNIKGISELVHRAESAGVSLAVFPELSITGYTCGDLFEQRFLLERAENGVRDLCRMTQDTSVLYAVGCPVVHRGERYNCAVAIYRGKVVAIVPKTHIPNYGEFYEKRWFRSGRDAASEIVSFAESRAMFGAGQLIGHDGVWTGMEICEDVWVPEPPSGAMASAGADLILNLSASDELIGKHDYLVRLLSQQSARCRCGYVYASAGWGESSTDLVFAGNAIVCEDGAVTEPEHRFFTEPMMVTRDIDIEKLRSDRERFNTFYSKRDVDAVRLTVEERMETNGGFPIRGVEGLNGNCTGCLNREEDSDENNRTPDIFVDPLPFVPHDSAQLRRHCDEIVNIQARGLMQRLHVIGCKTAVVGISGGLDSTLALLVTVRAFDLLGLDRKGITGITMPGMATTSRTHGNALGLMAELGVTSLEITIGAAVRQHFEDIGQDPSKYDVTFENSQARERTQILMDYANKTNGIVIGTGDMSELALGWCTYNGDQMSMYGVNASVPKTLVRHLVEWFADETGGRGAEILRDIAATPISPELVPSGNDEIVQITEDLVGPYELHDFYMYHTLRNAFAPAKVLMLAYKAFGGKYDRSTLLRWLHNFYRRFFGQQFKRSCMPDGPKVGSVNLSPRGDWRMPSDASARMWLEETERLMAQ